MSAKPPCEYHLWPNAARWGRGWQGLFYWRCFACEFTAPWWWMASVWGLVKLPGLDIQKDVYSSKFIRRV